MNFKELEENIDLWLDDYRPVEFDPDCHKDSELYSFYITLNPIYPDSIIINAVQK